MGEREALIDSVEREAMAPREPEKYIEAMARRDVERRREEKEANIRAASTGLLACHRLDSPGSPSIPDAVNRLDRSLATLQETIDELADRLSPVLTPDGSCDQMVSGVIGGLAGCPLSGRLVEADGRVEEMANRVRGLISRLGL